MPRTKINILPSIYPMPQPIKQVLFQKPQKPYTPFLRRRLRTNSPRLLHHNTTTAVWQRASGRKVLGRGFFSSHPLRFPEKCRLRTQEVAAKGTKKDWGSWRRGGDATVLRFFFFRGREKRYIAQVLACPPPPPLFPTRLKTRQS